jgi:hypothetical protein
MIIIVMIIRDTERERERERERLCGQNEGSVVLKLGHMHKPLWIEWLISAYGVCDFIIVLN